MDVNTMVIAELVGKALATAVIGYLYRVHREPALGAWALGWLGVTICSALFAFGYLNDPRVLVATSLIMVGAATAFLWGTDAMVGRRFRTRWKVVLGSTGLWVIVGPAWFGASGADLVVSIPVSVTFGVAMMSVGWSLVRHSGVDGFERIIAGSACILWGIHVVDYPFLGRVEWFAPYGFLISFALQTTCAIGMLLLYLRRDRQRLQQAHEQMARGQRMEALGLLAGGIAHDFNNFLTVMSGNLDLAKREPGNLEYLDHAQRATDRAADLTRQLLGFSRRQVVRPEIIDLGESVRNAMHLLERLIGENIRLAVRCDGPCCIRADVGHIEQIVVNLAVNARDAMPDGGSLEFSIRSVEFANATAWFGGVLRPGRYAELAVTDSGTGFPVDRLEELFEPFATTKAAGSGTGLGLSIVRSLTECANGGVFVEPGDSGGSRFRVLFPHTYETPRALEAKTPIGDQAGSESVLVVEDDPSLRSLLVRCLRSKGFDVRSAPNGIRARELFEGPGREGFDALISDVVMPGVSGFELSLEFRRCYPGAAVLLISGYSAGEFDPVPDGCQFLAKPFSPAELVSALRGALDSRPVASSAT